MVQRLCAVVVGILAVVCAIPRATAQPQPASPAEAAFLRGREMLKIGKYVEACAEFAESERLEPKLETRFNIALCSEQLGKLATALALHRELAKVETHPQRQRISAERVTQLSARVPRLRIRVAGTRRGKVPAGLVLRVGDEVVTDLDHHPIDLGTHRLVAAAPGFRGWAGEVTARVEGKTIPVTVKLERADDPAREPAGAPDPAGDPGPPEGLMPRRDPGGRQAGSGSRRKVLALGALVGGGLGLGVGITFGVLASSKWTDAKGVCGGATTCATPQDLARANVLADEARVRGNISTIAVVAGSALVISGVVLYLTAPRAARSVALAPGAAPSSATLTVSGRF